MRLICNMASGSYIYVNAKKKEKTFLRCLMIRAPLALARCVHFSESKSVLRSVAPCFLFVRKTLLDFMKGSCYFESHMC